MPRIRSRVALALVTLVCALVSLHSPTGSPRPVHASLAGAGLMQRAYVTNSLDDTVSVIDTVTDTVISTITVGRQPMGAAVSPGATKVYVFNYVECCDPQGVNGTVSVIDAPSLTVEATIEVGEQPVAIAVSNDGRLVFVSNSTSRSISVIDATINTVVETIPIDSRPNLLSLTSDGERLLVPNSAGLTVVDIATLSISATIAVDGGLISAVQNPVSGKVYASQPFGIRLIDLDNLQSIPLTSTSQVVFSLATNPVTAEVYAVTNWCCSNGTIIIFDSSNDTLEETIAVGLLPSFAAVTPDGSRLYAVMNGDDAVSVIDLNMRVLTTAVPVGGAPFGIATAPGDDSAPVVTISSPSDLSVNPVGVVVSFSGTDTGSGLASIEGFLNGSAVPNGAVVNVAGVHTLMVIATDNAGNHANEAVTFVVYDPSGGFVTGSGRMNSGAGACQLSPTCATASGGATFAFVSRYQKGATAPSGITQFRFQAGDLDFQSGSYEWLVVAGSKGMFKGTGTVNGSTGYGFLLSAVDGALAGGAGADKFRLKVWDLATTQTVYDNQLGDAETAEPVTAITSGSIIIHK